MTHYTCTHPLKITYTIKGNNNTAIFNYYKSPTSLPKIVYTLGTKWHREHTNTPTVIPPFTGGDRRRQEYKCREPILALSKKIPYNDADNTCPEASERKKPYE